MDLANLNVERLHVASYELYLIFNAMLLLMVFQFRQVLNANSIAPIKIAAALLIINLVVVWLGDQIRIPLLVEHPTVFYIMFYTTMISVPGVLFYTLNYIHNSLIDDDMNYLPLK